MKITTIFSLMSITISGIIFFFNYKLTNKYNNLVSGQLALQIREDISSAKERYEDLNIQYFLNGQNIILKPILEESRENLCNTYNLVCLLYNSDKLDKKIFETQYSNKIKSVVESKHFNDKYVQPYTKYQATIDVYNKWFKSKK